MNEGMTNILMDMPLNQKKNILQAGYFVFIEGETEGKGITYFMDAFRKIHPMDKVYGISTEWNTEDGNKLFPKPYIADKDLIIKEFGDNIAYTFMDDENNILILGSIVPYKLNNFDALLNYDFNDLKNLHEKNLVRNNKKRYFSVSEDADGNITIYLEGKGEGENAGTGNLGIKIAGTDKNGNLKLEMNGKFLLNQLQGEEVIAQILMDNTQDAEKIKVIDKYKNEIATTKDGIKVIDKSKNIIEMNEKGMILETKSVRIGKSETMMKILLDLIAAILAMTQGTAAGGPTIATKFNQAEFEGIKNRLKEFMGVQ